MFVEPFRAASHQLSHVARMMTDPNMVGVEKLSTTVVPKEFLDSPYRELPAAIGGTGHALSLHVAGFSLFVILFMPPGQEHTSYLHFLLDIARDGNAQQCA